MATITKFEITGMEATLDIFKQLESEIGDKQARSKILIPAVREAMKPVLQMAKSLAPKDTGVLENTLGISARRPTRNDKKSKYVSENDTVISIVTTKNIPKKLKKQFSEQYKGLSGKALKKAKRSFYSERGIPYDGRAVANEFGTAKMAAQPFMRVSMESQAQAVSNKLGEIIKRRIEQYRSKSIK
jgi:HK97 gp10 family phage protein